MRKLLAIILCIALVAGVYGMLSSKSVNPDEHYSQVPQHIYSKPVAESETLNLLTPSMAEQVVEKISAFIPINIPHDLNISNEMKRGVSNAIQGLCGQVLDKEGFRKAIRQFDEEAVLDGIAELAGIKKEQIPKGMSTYEYAEKLYELAFRDTSEEEFLSTTELAFSSSVYIDNSPLNPTEEFYSLDSKIYATFPNYAWEYQGLISKWYNANSKDIVFFGYNPIGKNREWNYMAIQDDSWDEGKYVVEFYLLEDTETPIAAGDFTVSNALEEYTYETSALTLFEDASCSESKRSFTGPLQSITVRFNHSAESWTHTQIKVYKAQQEVSIQENSVSWVDAGIHVLTQSTTPTMGFTRGRYVMELYVNDILEESAAFKVN